MYANAIVVWRDQADQLLEYKLAVHRERQLAVRQIQAHVGRDDIDAGVVSIRAGPARPTLRPD